MLLSLALLSTCLTAAPPDLSSRATVYPLRYHLAADGAATGALMAGWLSTEAVFKKNLAPATCRWCEDNAFDAWGRGLRGAPGQLLFYDTASGVVAFGALPVAMLAADLWLAWSNDALDGAAVDLLIISEAVAVALAMNQVVKFAVGRERPFVHALPEAEKGLTLHPTDNNLSFFSGHSTFAFVIAVATGTVANLRGYQRAWLVWAVGLPIAAAAPLLRMASDRHYLSDVLTGSLWGAAVGYGLPTLLHGRATRATGGTFLRLVPAPGGLAIAGMF